MKKSTKTIQCHACGTPFEAEVIISDYQRDSWLDGKPIRRDPFAEIPVCPSCGERALRIEADADTTQYAAAKAHYHLMLCWHYEMEERPEEAAKERGEAVSFMEKSFSGNVTPDEVVVHIDCLRQLGRFDRAQEAIDEARNWFETSLPHEKGTYRAFRFECGRVEEQDPQPYRFSDIE